MRHRITAGIVALTVIGGITGCGSHTTADKTGEQTLVIRLGTIDELNPNGQTVAPGVFVSQIDKLSGGSIKVQVVDGYGGGAATAESDMITAIGRGDLDGGFPTVRAFAAAGHTGFEAVEAPFVVTSTAAEAAIVTGPVGKALLETLDDTEVIGVGIAAGVLRRPFAVKPLRTPKDWRGLSIRDYNSPVQQLTLTALGATPVSAGFGFHELVRQHKLQGAEIDLPQYAHENYGPLLPAALRNVVLWPKMTVITLNRRLYEQLTEPQRGWVQQAADAAVHASATYPYDDATPAAQICETGVKLYDASPADVNALRTAVQPVYGKIGSDPVAGPLLDQVQDVVARHPGVDVPKVPAECMGS